MLLNFKNMLLSNWKSQLLAFSILGRPKIASYYFYGGYLQRIFLSMPPRSYMFNLLHITGKEWINLTGFKGYSSGRNNYVEFVHYQDFMMRYKCKSRQWWEMFVIEFRKNYILSRKTWNITSVASEGWIISHNNWRACVREGVFKVVYEH